MKGALFHVLCEIKEKSGNFFFVSRLRQLLLQNVNSVQFTTVKMRFSLKKYSSFIIKIAELIDQVTMRKLYDGVFLF